VPWASNRPLNGRDPKLGSDSRARSRPSQRSRDDRRVVLMIGAKAGLLAAPCERDRQRIIEELARKEFGAGDEA